MPKQVMIKDTEADDTTAISLRHVKKGTWRDFRKLATLADMTLQDYLEALVAKEMERVLPSKKRA